MGTNNIFDGVSGRKYEVTAEELERRYDQIRSSLAANDLNPKKITSAVGSNENV